MHFHLFSSLIASLLYSTCYAHVETVRYELTYEAIFNNIGNENNVDREKKLKDGVSLDECDCEKVFLPTQSDLLLNGVHDEIVNFWELLKSARDDSVRENVQGDVLDVEDDDCDDDDCDDDDYNEEDQEDKNDEDVQCLKSGKKVRCFVEYSDKDDDDFELVIESKAHELGSYEKSLILDSLIEPKDDVSNYWSLQLSIIVKTTESTFARDSLIYVLEEVLECLHIDESLLPIWSIDKRISLGRHHLDEKDMIQEGAIPHQIKKSLEQMVLARSDMISRKALVTRSHEWDIEDPSSLEQENLSVDIWEVEELGHRPVTHLFLDGNLRASTGDSSIANAEAFVHPTLISHPDPRHIAIMSDMPLPLLKEVLKYKSIEEITLVGVDRNVLDIVTTHMNVLNECFIDGELTECTKDKRVNFIVDETDEKWLESVVSNDQKYDVIIVSADTSDEDVEEKFFSYEFSEQISKIMDDNSVTVFNAEYAPVSDVEHDKFKYYYDRDEFLETVSSDDSSPYGQVILYEESAAYPFFTTFVVLFSNVESGHLFTETYGRFLRSTHTVIDLDMVERFHKQQNNRLPTRFYDGPTHVSYLNPSRVWENFYCESKEMGRGSVLCDFVQEKFYNPSQYEGVTEIKRDSFRGRALYAVNNIKEGMFINSDDTYLSLHMEKFQWDALNNFVEEYPDASMYKDLQNFYISYGYENEAAVNGK